MKFDLLIKNGFLIDGTGNESALLPLSPTLMAHSFGVALGWGSPVALRAPSIPSRGHYTM